MSDSPRLRVYVKPGCPWCVDALAWLRREEFDFEEIDVYADPGSYGEMQRLSGQSCAPTLTYGDLLLADFDVGEMRAFFEEHGITAGP